MSHWITLVTAHGRINAWAAEPDDKPNGGVVLVHEIFGVNDDMRRIAQRYADAGYLTLVPALFDKIQRDVELTYDPENRQMGIALAERLGIDDASELVNTAADAIGHAGKVAVVGYGWGGNVALRAANAMALPCVSYYAASNPIHEPGEASVPILVHKGDTDPQFSPGYRQRLQKNRPGSQVFTYPTGHAFDREGDPGHHHAESMELAFKRSRQFLRKHIYHENN